MGRSYSGMREETLRLRNELRAIGRALLNTANEMDL